MRRLGGGDCLQGEKTISRSHREGRRTGQKGQQMQKSGAEAIGKGEPASHPPVFITGLLTFILISIECLDILNKLPLTRQDLSHMSQVDRHSKASRVLGKRSDLFVSLSCVRQPLPGVTHSLRHSAVDTGADQ